MRLFLRNTPAVVLVLCGLVCGCSHKKPPAMTTFGDDVTFLKKHTDVMVLADSSGKSKIAVAPALQGRVLTSTADGDTGESFGWINRAYFDEASKAGKSRPHISPFGGEDRFWLGPEGGQFSIFFAPGDPFDLDHWYTPAFIDREPFNTVSQSGDSAVFHRHITFSNYSGTRFDVNINRTIRLLSMIEGWHRLGKEPVGDVNIVAFESDNVITNNGADLMKQTGLLSIWILGMFNASPDGIVVIPIQPGPESSLGPMVNDDYFGKVPSDRLKVTDRIIYFKADANYRSKIGIPPQRAQPVMGSYDPARKLLTIVQFSYNPDVKDYVNSAWKLQDNPYGGDVANSYNDGPPKPGKPQLGKFYELESSSPAVSLPHGESMHHVHRTFHLQGDEGSLKEIAKETFGVTLDQIEDAFKSK